MAYYSHIELQSGIICACMPAIRSLLRRMFPSKQSTFGSGYLASSFQSNQKATSGDGDFVRLNDLEYGTARYTPEPAETGSGQPPEVRTLQVDKVNYTVGVEPKKSWPL